MFEAASDLEEQSNDYLSVSKDALVGRVMVDVPEGQTRQVTLSSRDLLFGTELDDKGEIINPLIEITLTANAGEWQTFYVAANGTSFSFDNSGEYKATITVKDEGTRVVLDNESVEIVNEDYEVLYRAAMDHPDNQQPEEYANALQGIVVPYGWNSDKMSINPQRHIDSYGRSSNSAFSSWSTGQVGIVKHQVNTDYPHVLIKVKLPVSQIMRTWSKYGLDDIYSVDEVVVIGPINNCHTLKLKD